MNCDGEEEGGERRMRGVKCRGERGQLGGKRRADGISVGVEGSGSAFTPSSACSPYSVHIVLQGLGVEG